MPLATNFSSMDPLKSTVPSELLKKHPNDDENYHKANSEIMGRIPLRFIFKKKLIFTPPSRFPDDRLLHHMIQAMPSIFKAGQEKYGDLSIFFWGAMYDPYYILCHRIVYHRDDIIECMLCLYVFF